ncbi:hypothetical protein BGX31_010901, partial [Mortierella sp. GBA43]
MSGTDSFLVDLAFNGGSDSASLQATAGLQTPQNLSQLQMAQLQASRPAENYDLESSVSKDLFENMEPHLRLPTWSQSQCYPGHHRFIKVLKTINDRPKDLTLCYPKLETLNLDMNDGYHKGFCSTWETENAEMEDGEKKTEDNYRRVPKGSGRADLVEKNPTLTTLLLSRVGISFMDTT